MNIDEKIKQELENEAEQFDELLNHNQGMISLSASALKGGLGNWLIVVFVIILIVSGFMIWFGYRFYVADNVDARVFWGVWFVAALGSQIALKQWVWMETNRVSLLREVKRVEVAVAKLTSKLEN